MFEEIFKFFIGASVGASVIVYLGKKLIDHLSESGIEKYKAELKEVELKRTHEYDLSIEKHKSELEKLNMEFQIKQSVLQTELLNIIRKTYELLVKFENPLEYMFRPVKFNPEKTQDELAGEVIENVNKFFSFTSENDVVFTDSISEIIDKIKNCVFRVWKTYTTKQFMGQNISGEMSIKLNDDMMKAYEEILQKEMQDLKRALKVEFRSQLGVSKEIIEA
jgi:hypothetical protein